MPIEAISGEVSAPPHNRNMSYLDSEKVSIRDLHYKNVAYLGAKGDGIVNDTPFFQTGLDGGNVHLVVPSGIFRLESPLIVYQNTHIELHKDAVLLRAHNGDIFVNGDGLTDYYGYTGNGNITVEGGTLDGNVIDYPSAFVALNFGHGENIHIKDMTIKDVSWAHAIELNACKNILIENCKFLGFYDALGDRQYAEAIQIDVPTAQSFSPFGHYDGTPTIDVTVRDCLFGASDTSGTVAWGVGVGGHNAIHDVFCDNITVVNNTFDGCTWWAVRSFKFNNVQVNDNTFKGCFGGVLVSIPVAESENTKDKDGVQQNIPQASKNYIISDNKFIDMSVEDAIGVYGRLYNLVAYRVKNIKVNGNLFENIPSTRSCFASNYCENLDVGDNTAINGMRGFYADNSINVYITDCHFKDMTEGIRVNNIQKLKLSQNKVFKAQKEAYRLTGIEDFTLIGNEAYETGLETHDTYSTYDLSTTCKRGFLMNNIGKMATSGNQNRNGIIVTSSCEHVYTSNNYVEGVTLDLNMASAAGKDGLIHYAPDGTRYIMSVDNAGALTITGLTI